MTDPRRQPNEHPRGICQACGRGYCASGEAWCDVCIGFDDVARREAEHDQRLNDNEERPWEREMQNYGM